MCCWTSSSRRSTTWSRRLWSSSLTSSGATPTGAAFLGLLCCVDNSLQRSLNNQGMMASCAVSSLEYGRFMQRACGDHVPAGYVGCSVCKITLWFGEYSRYAVHALTLLCCVACRYETIIATLCDSLDSLDEPEARAAMVWIIGEYAERIDNADELLESFLEV